MKKFADEEEVEAAVATVEWRVPHTIQVLGQIVDVVAVPTGVQDSPEHRRVELV